MTAPRFPFLCPSAPVTSLHDPRGIDIYDDLCPTCVGLDAIDRLAQACTGQAARGIDRFVGLEHDVPPEVLVDLADHGRSRAKELKGRGIALQGSPDALRRDAHMLFIFAPRFHQRQPGEGRVR